MAQIIVTAKTEAGLILICRFQQSEDGAAWHCASCGVICCRISFGMLNGFSRCRCGATVEITVDGKAIDISSGATEAPNEPIIPALRGNDDDFLKSCGIAAEQPEGGGK